MSKTTAEDRCPRVIDAFDRTTGRRAYEKCLRPTKVHVSYRDPVSGSTVEADLCGMHASSVIKWAADMGRRGVDVALFTSAIRSENSRKD